MFIYLLLFFILLCTSTQNNKRIRQSIIFVMILFFCFSYMTGSDWRVYETNFYRVPYKLRELVSYSKSTHEEIGYNFIVWLVRRIGIGFWPFHIAVKCIVFIILIKVIKSFHVNISLYFLIYYSSLCFMFIDCPFRNLIAIGIFLFSFGYIKSNNIMPYFISCAFATTIHVSALMMLPIYFIFHKKNTFNVYSVLLIMIGLYLVSFMGSGVIDLVNSVMVTNEYAEERLSSYAASIVFAHGSINIITIYNLIMFVVVFMYRKSIEKQQYGRELLNLYYFSQVILPITTSFRMFGRFSAFLSVLTPIIIILLFKSIKEMPTRISIIGFVLVFSLAKSFFVLTNDCRYIPYTNYLQYVKEQPSFYYRDNFNPNNSPYKDFR